MAGKVTPVLVRPKIKYPDMTSNVPPHYKLILHKDSQFVHKHVSQVLSEVIVDMSRPEANDKTTEAYLNGTSLLRVCPEDIAISYCNDITKNNVSATIEPVDFF
jgi:ATP-dependent Clp protease adapter protein ClpS